MNNDNLETFRKRLKFAVPKIQKNLILQSILKRRESHEELFTLISMQSGGLSKKWTTYL
jgi:hypothetical protein